MSDIIKITPELTALQKSREEHVPRVGDIYVDEGQCSAVCKITAIKEHGDYNDYEYVEWDFQQECWVEPERFHRNFKEKQFYRWIPEGIEAITALEKAAYSGKSLLQQQAGQASDSTALVTQGRAKLESLLSDSEAMQDTLESVRMVMEVRIEQQKQLMQQKAKELKKQLSVVKKQYDNIKKTIGLLEMYTGLSLEIKPVITGQPAPAGTPLAIRQRILFMDEEMAVVENGAGLDYRDTSRFAEWLKNPENRDIIVPEQRCVVCMKPRRFDRQYTHDSLTNRLLNRWNHHTFIVMRNGENVYMIESEDICIYDAAIPRKKDLAGVESLLQSRWETDKERAIDKQEDLNWRAAQLAMIIQGIDDNTDVFLPRTESLSVAKGVGVEFIFDDEEDSLLGTGLKPFNEFVKDSVKTLRRGSRIIYFGGGYPNRWELRAKGWNENHKIATPEYGIYNIDKDDKGISFTYLPHGDVYTYYEVKDRSRHERWIVDESGIVNFDALDIDILEAYLKDRTQRQAYESLIPLLGIIRRELKKEREYENLFKTQLKRVLEAERIQCNDTLLEEAVKWWKTKVIRIRPIDSDDDKAWRMIKGYIKRNS